MFSLSFAFAFHSLLQLSYVVVAQSQDSCLLTNNGNGLPPFTSNQGYSGGPDRRIHHRHQAIITSYRLNCCGKITQWGVDLNPNKPSIMFSFILQVWRPAPNVNETGCYRLVDDFISTNISLSSSVGVARVAPSSADHLQFQPGDVLGFYVESHGEGSGSGGDPNNGVVLLTSSSYSSELVWHGSIDAATTQMSRSSSCPYPVGATEILDSQTHAAPVISISITTYSCPEPTYSSYNPHPLSSARSFNSASRTLFFPAATSLSTPTLIHVPGRGPMIHYSGLISGIVVSIVVCVSIVTAVIIIAIVVAKRHNRKTLNHYQTSTGIALSNQVYGAPTMAQTNATYELPVNNKPVSKESGARYIESAQYHSVGPNTSKARTSHTVYSGDYLENSVVYATAGQVQVGMKAESDNVYENPDTKEATPYEIPREGIPGLYVPTAEERSNLGGQSEMQGQDLSTGVYSKLKFFIEDQIYWTPASTTADLYSQLASKKYREIPREQIKSVKLLGSGEFGDVYKAVWSISGTTKEVAVKSLKPGLSENDKVRFLQEAAIMGQFNHPYVVKLYGVVTIRDPMMICIELMVSGDLRGYLGTVSPNKYGFKELELKLLKFSRQIASGMAYLSKKAFVHRDLAARNILLDESLTCKISDFGMARDLADDTYYTVQSKGGKIPIKWTAPEALFYKKYSTDSDIWSYGMVLFEIWSVGKKPFSEMSNSEVVRKINSGYCQPPPPGTPRPIYQLMVNCWNPIHSQRPPFSKISATLNASNSTLLQWIEDDRSVAGELGGQLSEAQFLYQDLQNTYHVYHHAVI